MPTAQRLERRLDAALRQPAPPGRRRWSASRGVSIPRSIQRPSRSPRVGPGEPWFCLEQPDRDGYAVAAIGSGARSKREERIASRLWPGAGRRWRPRRSRTPRRPARLGAARARRVRVRARRRRLAAVAGLRAGVAGRARGVARPRRPGGCRSPSTSIAPDDDAEDLRARGRRLDELRAAAAAARPGAGRALHGPQPDAARPTTRRRWRRAVQRIRAGELEKIVLAREVEVTRRSTTTRAPCSACSARRSLVFRVRGRARRAALHRREPRAAGAPGGAAGEHRRAGRIHSAQRRSRG